jgi:hypothetical protein
MRLNNTYGMMRLMGITRDDIYYTNLEGSKKDANGMFVPHHDYGVWISDPDILNFFRENGVEIKSVQDSMNPEIVRYAVRFRAYPKIKIDEFGNPVQVPKVMIKGHQNDDGDGYFRRNEDRFSDADTKRVKQVVINFRWYHPASGNTIPVINEIWVELDQFASGPVEDDLLERELNGRE